MDLDSLPTVMQQPLVERALKELIMLAQNDVERERYEARRKWQLDFNTGMKVAQLKGLEQGLDQGPSSRLECDRDARQSGSGTSDARSTHAASVTQHSPW